MELSSFELHLKKTHEAVCTECAGTAKLTTNYNNVPVNFVGVVKPNISIKDCEECNGTGWRKPRS